MDFTPQMQNTAEDSGCLTGSANTPISFISDFSSASYCIETPVTTSSICRKRKLSHSNFERLNNEDHSEQGEHFFDNDTTTSRLLSSTLNEHLSKSLEKCNLGSSNFLYLVESPSHLDGESEMKKYKLDDSPKYQPKTRSAPSTPTKHFDSEELAYVKQKSKSEQLDICNHTPVKNNYSGSRLGSPELIELLYPNIKITPSPLKLKTPEKLREFLRKIHSPAKKRLFETFKHEENRFIKRTDHDPISVFVVKNDFRHIVSRIFEFLSDSDLCNVSKVSRTWKKALLADPKAFPRYYTYYRGFNSNKENIVQDVSPSCSEYHSPPSSPSHDIFHRCTKIASQLLPTQSLQKCVRCMEPAVIQNNISQCQNPNCEYIYCTKCLSFSMLGPEHFTDKCQTSKLIVNATKNMNCNRLGLCDISNGGNENPSFLFTDSPKYTPPTQSKYDSSGYLSGNEVSPMILQSDGNLQNSGIKNVLVSRNINRVEKSFTRRKHRSSSFASVVSASNSARINENVEPMSPPRREHLACSKQSKKNLKRLQF